MINKVEQKPKEEKKMIRINVALPLDTHTELRVYCVARRKKLSEFTPEVILKGLEYYRDLANRNQLR